MAKRKAAGRAVGRATGRAARKAAGRTAGRTAEGIGWSIPIKPLLLFLISAGIIGTIASIRKTRTGPRPSDKDPGAWTKDFLLTPPITPRPGARGLYEDAEILIERQTTVDCSQIPKPDPATGFYPELPPPGSPWEICYKRD